MSDANGVLVYDRILGDRWCRVLLNMRGEPVVSPCGREGIVALSTHGEPLRREASERIPLRPDEGIVLLPRGREPGRPA